MTSARLIAGFRRLDPQKCAGETAILRNAGLKPGLYKFIESCQAGRSMLRPYKFK
jgi:hypothetical protein